MNALVCADLNLSPKLFGKACLHARRGRGGGGGYVSDGVVISALVISSEDSRIDPR